MSNYYDLGSFLRYIRKTRKLSLRNLSKELNIAHSTISDIERGVTRIQKIHIDKFINYMGFNDQEMRDFLLYVTLNRSDIYDPTMKFITTKRVLYDFIQRLSRSGFSDQDINKITKSFYEMLDEYGDDSNG